MLLSWVVFSQLATVTSGLVFRIWDDFNEGFNECVLKTEQ